MSFGLLVIAVKIGLFLICACLRIASEINPLEALCRTRKALLGGNRKALMMRIAHQRIHPEARQVAVRGKKLAGHGGSL